MPACDAAQFVAVVHAALGGRFPIAGAIAHNPKLTFPPEPNRPSPARGDAGTFCAATSA